MPASVLPDPLHPIMQFLWPLGPDSPSEDRVGAVVAAYTERTGVVPSNPLTPEDRKRIADWLLAEEENMPRNELGQSLPLTRGPLRTFVPLVHRNLSMKLAYLQQRACEVCEYLPLRPLSIAFAVNMRPFSAQAEKRKKRLAAIELRIKEHLRSRKQLEVPGWRGQLLCLKVVALQSTRDNVKDVDNLIKGLLDAMQDVLYDNDNSIQHVSSQRVIHAGSEAFYLVQLFPVRDARLDVFDLSLPPGWLAGQDEIDIGNLP